jgi:citrate lyase subunit beta/citryl-CoA lyase
VTSDPAPFDPAPFDPAPFSLGPALLFCPADRPDRYAKALDRADAVILDLEDAVAAADKQAARVALAEHPLDPARVVVRVNPPSTPDFAADLAALEATPYRRIMVAKADAALPAVPGFQVIALCETAAGILDARDLARRREVVALMWGAEDLIASLGGTSSRDHRGRYRKVVRHARAAVLLAAGAEGVAAIDAVHLAIDDLDGLRAEAADAVASGFAASACIHPSHVAVIRDAYRPTPAEVAAARRVLDAAATGGAVFQFEGRMIDGPVLRHAESVLRRASTPLVE